MKKVWDALSGYKTIIGMTILLAAQGLKVFAPELLTIDQLDFLRDVGSVIGGVGLFDKTAKNERMKALINKALSKATKQK